MPSLTFPFNRQFLPFKYEKDAPYLTPTPRVSNLTKHYPDYFYFVDIQNIQIFFLMKYVIDRFQTHSTTLFSVIIENVHSLLIWQIKVTMTLKYYCSTTYNMSFSTITLLLLIYFEQ